ncbi:MAG: serine hydrolase domain-containing protein [Gemmatimonadaceae bacterium]
MLKHANRTYAVAAIVLSAQVAQSQDPATAAAIDLLVTSEMRARRIPGVAIAIVDNGNVVLRKAYGIANVETETPVSVNSVFELASVTKQFTAAGIMLLVEEGKVRLDDSITKYFDQPPDIWQGLTVRQLLTHTAGLQSGGVVNHEGSPLLYISTKQAYDMIAGRPLFLAPGTHGFYADAGYFLLGMITEKASGMSWRSFMQRRIFEPLQMTQSSVLDKRRIVKRRVATYELSGSGGSTGSAGTPGDSLVNWRRDWQYELPSFFGIFSTLDDLAKWSTALQRRTLLKAASWEEMWTPAKLHTGGHAIVIGDLYGLGFLISDVAGQRFAGHDGASGTFILHFLDKAISIIVLTNLSSTAGRHAPTLARTIAGLYSKDYFVDWTTSSLDPTPAISDSRRALLPQFAAGRTTGPQCRAKRDPLHRPDRPDLQLPRGRASSVR